MGTIAHARDPRAGVLALQEEEQYLIDLMREEEAAQMRQQAAAAAAARREAAKQVRLKAILHLPERCKMAALVNPCLSKLDRSFCCCAAVTTSD